MEFYDEDFYSLRQEETYYSAKTILSIVENIVPKLTSAIDLGCGIGIWLKALEDKEVNDIVGVEGDWVDKSQLHFSEEKFTAFDLRNRFDINKKFDLAISLEVAEHLPHESAENLVLSLTEASDFVLFSAAIPGQQGVNHINEQWLNYWITHFEKYGYVGLDYIRKIIWNDDLIPYYYRQNIVLFVKKDRVPDLNFENKLVNHLLPETYHLGLNRTVISPGIFQSVRNLIVAIKAWLGFNQL